ncbi:hypothetical protein IIB49_00460 [Patescibacteria group bacterium]|nr:hypothetical protein [Patescibacteria group bacterium]
MTRNDAGIPVTQEEQQAIDILGENKVIFVSEVAAKWDIKVPEDLLIPFPEEVLLRCAEENKAGKADWRLVYVSSLSLREQRELRGTDRDRQPCFHGYENPWWLNKSEDSWTTEQKKADYRLLNLQLQFSNRNWQEQTDDVAKLGNEYERASEKDIAEAILSVFMTTEERLFEHTYHWGHHSLNSGHSRVIVGSFGFSGLEIDRAWPGQRYPFIGVVVARKF